MTESSTNPNDHTVAPETSMMGHHPHEGPGVPVPNSIRVLSTSGPFPPPEVMREYNEVVPGMAQAMLAHFDVEQAHRHSLEMEPHSAVRRAQYMAAFLLFFVLVIFAGSLLKGIPIGVGAWVVPLVGLVSAGAGSLFGRASDAKKQ